MGLEVFHTATLGTTAVESFVKDCFYSRKWHSSRLEPYCEDRDVLRKNNNNKPTHKSVFKTSISILLQPNRITGSQNGWGWKRSLETVWSHAHAQAASPRAGCSGLLMYQTCCFTCSPRTWPICILQKFSGACEMNIYGQDHGFVKVRIGSLLKQALFQYI